MTRLFVVVLFVSPCLAQQGSWSRPLSKRTKAEIRRFIDAMESDDFWRREEATKNLWTFLLDDERLSCLDSGVEYLRKLSQTCDSLDVRLRLLRIARFAEHCISYGLSKRMPRLLPALRIGDEAEKLNIARLLIGGDANELKVLKRMLLCGGRKLSEGMIALLAESGDSSAVELLLDVLRTTDHELCVMAAEALRKLGKDAVKALIGALSDASAAVRRNAAKALGELKAPEAFDPLLKLLNDNDPSVRSAAILGVGRTGDKKAIPFIVKMLKDERHIVRATAARILTEIGDETVVPHLLPLLKDSEYSVRRRAVKALKRVSGKNINPLLKALREGDTEVRVAVVGILGSIGGEKTLSAILRVLGNGEKAVRVAACDALAEMGEKSALKGLSEALRDSEQEVVSSAEQAILAIADRDDVALFLFLLKEKDAGLRRRGVRIIGELRGDAALGALIGALGDDSWEVRYEAARYLGRFGNAEAAEPLIETLKDEKECVRKAAATSLGHIGSLKAVEPLIEVATNLAESREVRMAAAVALCRFGKTEYLDRLEEGR